jgi:two-component system, LuxR family, response regulator FixJ
MIKDPESIIYIVDDDESVRKGISLLLVSGGYKTEMFGNMGEFLASCDCNSTGCILLDIFLGVESGLELHDEIKDKYSNLPVIYITGHGDVPMSVRALKNGALNFLQKPVDEKHLFPAVKEALDLSLSLYNLQQEKNLIKAKINSLTSREFEIFRQVIKGMLNKQIAAELNIAEHTVKLHRGKITEKLGVKSVPEMIYMAEKIQII